MDSVWKLLGVLALVLANGFFVAAEFALVSVRSTRIDQLAEEGNRRAKKVQQALADPNRFISAAQVGITMASLGLGWIAEPAIADLITPLFHRIFGEDTTLPIHLISFGIAYFLVTLLHIVIGEQVPKMIALQRSEKTILLTASPIELLAIPFKPIISLLYWLTEGVLRMLGLEWQGEHHLVYSEDELKMLVTASKQQGYLEESEQVLIERVFAFADHKAEEVMVPRTEMIAIPGTSTAEEVMKTIAETGYARYPVYGENIDDIIGVFYAKDLFRVLARNPTAKVTVRRLMRPALVISERTPLDELLATMKRDRTHIAIVVDEYGGTAGMVTLEDVLERIVGDVSDEFERGADDFEELQDGVVRVSGLVPIDQINDRFDLKIDDPYYNTIGGYVFGQLGRRPEIGDVVETDGTTFTVSELDGLRIDRIDVRAPQAESAEPLPGNVDMRVLLEETSEEG